MAALARDRGFRYVGRMLVRDWTARCQRGSTKRFDSRRPDGSYGGNRMNSPTHGRPAPLFARALLAIIGWILFAPSAAHAGCSHYVQTTSDMSVIAHDIDFLSAPRPLENPRSTRASEIPTRPEPCSGALCSGRPVPLPAPAPLTDHQRGGSWAILVEAPRVALSEPVPCSRDDGIVQTHDTQSSVFHPPRS